MGTSASVKDRDGGRVCGRQWGERLLGGGARLRTRLRLALMFQFRRDAVSGDGAPFWFRQGSGCGRGLECTRARRLAGAFLLPTKNSEY